ncbi:relaxin receptor 1-like [Protopterus annectens]|uniref:relaxin receptor 1-like n=1 Tax=Protopterus annectens TaxID=7888 RepID=UPI001CF94640|nr:relaxin receptor 1-like [Protopterus annectens]
MTLTVTIFSLLYITARSLMIPASPVHCKLGYFPCGNSSHCLPQLLHCNGVPDCENGADEEDCGDNIGWAQLLTPHQKNSFEEEEPTGCLLEIFPEICKCKNKIVDCTEKGLTSIPDRISLNVTELDLKNNKFSVLPDYHFSQYVNLEKLYLQNNEIHSISHMAFAGLLKLKVLYLSHNNITKLKPDVFKDLRELQWLIMDNNNISKLVMKPFEGLKSLYFLSLLNNSIQQIPRKYICADLPNLNWLDLEGNKIHTIKHSIFYQCSNITVLVLRRNKIKTVENSTFSQMVKLVELDLSYNLIEELPPSLFRNLQRLQQLNVSENPLKKIYVNQFEGLVSLQSLSIEGVEICNISTQMFEPLKNLSHIYFKTFQYCGFSPRVRSCKPNSDGISSFENLLANIILRVFVWVIACVTCFGNIFVICLRFCIIPENRQHTMSIRSLCCADFLMGVYLFCIGTFDLKYYGEYNRHAKDWMDSNACQLIGFLAMLSSEVSVMLLTYMTLEKFFCIVFPFRNCSVGKKQTLFTLAVIWVLGFIIAVIPFWHEKAFGNYYGTNGVCFPLNSNQLEKRCAREYTAGIFLGLNLCAFISIVILYTSMFYSILKTGAKSAERSGFSREVSIAKRFFFIVFTDALCWIPIFLLQACSLLNKDIPGTIISWVVIFILPINSALNPILYTMTTTSFREHFKQCLEKKNLSGIMEPRKSFMSSSLHDNHHLSQPAS